MNEQARAFILDRFKTDGAKKRGGVSSAAIFGSRAKVRNQFSVPELEAELLAMRREGVLAYTSGLWWKRNA